MSNSFVAPLFKDIDRLHFYGIHVKEYNGIAGIYKLSKKIKEDIAFDAIADLHNVLRTKLLRFFLSNKSTAIIDIANGTGITLVDAFLKFAELKAALKNDNNRVTAHSLGRYMTTYNKRIICWVVVFNT